MSKVKSYEQEIEAILDSLRPMIARDGGDIRFEKLDDCTVYVSLHGACIGCPAAIYTLKLGIEKAIKEKLPFIKEVIPT